MRLLLVILTSLATTAQADVGRGQRLHETNCLACHAAMVGGDGSALYTRAERRVSTLGELRRQVNRCKENLGLTWFDDEVEDVVQYLSGHYYQFQE